MILKRNKVKLILLILVASLFLSSCTGRGDWDYDLINGYRLVRSSAHTIQLCCDSKLSTHWGNSTIVLNCFYIKMITISEPFVGLQGITTRDYSASDEELSISKENYTFYLLDSSLHLLYGPYSKDSFYEKCTQVGITYLQTWISTEDINQVR